MPLWKRSQRRDSVKYPGSQLTSSRQLRDKVLGPVAGRQPSGAEEATLPKEVTAIMDQILDILKNFNDDLSDLEQSVALPHVDHFISKS